MSAARALALTMASLVGGCVSSAPAGVGRAAIVGGSDDAGDGAVVAIVDRRTRCDDASVRIVCSGTLIAPRVVLTAAHCLAEQGPGATWEVAFGSPIGSDPAGRFFVVTDVAVDPAWSDATHAHDLALMRLSDDAPVAPVPFATAPLPASLVGATVRVVGYGETTPGVAADGVRRQATMQVSAVDSGTFRADAAPGNSCGGDSGGPVLGDVGSGEQILGVTSSGDAACASYAVQARVDVAVAAFVQPYLDATAAAPSGRPAGVIGESAICQTACASAADCPDGLACLAGTPDRPAACGVTQAPPASYGATCAHDSDCGGATCARLWPDGADACRCATPCTAGPPPPMMTHHGCSVGGRAAPAPSWVLVVAVAAAARARARRRARSSR